MTTTTRNQAGRVLWQHRTARKQVLLRSTVCSWTNLTAAGFLHGVLLVFLKRQIAIRLPKFRSFFGAGAKFCVLSWAFFGHRYQAVDICKAMPEFRIMNNA